MSAQADERIREALSHYRAGKPGTAAAICRRILETDAGHAEAARLLAVILAESRRLREAISLLQAFARDARADPQLLYTLGRMQAQAGTYGQAAETLERAQRVDSENHLIPLALGYCLAQLGKPDEAACAYEAALERKPDDPAILRDYGEILGRLARFDEAITAYRRVLELDPGNPTAYVRLAGLYERTNRVEDMAEIVEAGLRHWPEDPALRFHRAVNLRRRDQPESALASLEQLQREAPPPGLGRKVAFETARIYDRMGQYDRAFEQARLGNRLAGELARQAAGDAEDYGDWLERVEQVFATAWGTAGPAQPAQGDHDDVVFILGFPRSGTTLIDVLLAARDEYQVYEEKPFLGELLEELRGHGLSYPECGDRLDAGIIRALRQRYFQAAGRFAVRRPGTVLVDKNPLATPAVPLLHQVFPRAKYIFAARHPLDVCLSCYLYSFSPNSALAECETVESIASAYAKTMAIWRLARRHLPLEVIEIPYETLIEDFAAESRRLFDFLGLPWDQGVPDLARHARAGPPTLRNYDRVIQGIYRTSRYRWRHYERYLAGVAPIVEEAGAYFSYTTASAR